MSPPPPPKRRSQDEGEDGHTDGVGVRVDVGGTEREASPTVPPPTHVGGLIEEGDGGSPAAALDSDDGGGHDCSPLSARWKGRCRWSTGTLEEDLERKEEEEEEGETWSQHEHWRVPGFLKGRGEGESVSGEGSEDLPPLAMEVGRVCRRCIGFGSQPRDKSKCLKNTPSPRE